MLLSVSANVTRNTLVNTQKKKTPDKAEFLLYNALCSIATCIILLIAGGGVGALSRYTFLLSVVYAAALVTSYQTLILAMREGPMSYTVLISTCGMIIPTLYGTFVYHEAVSVLQVIGFVVMPIGFYFGANPKKSDRITVKWAKYVFTCFFSNGMQGVLQKVLIRSDYAQENGMFLTSAFLVAAIILGGIYLLQKDKRKAEPGFLKKYKTSIIVGAMDAFQHKTNIVLSGVLPSIICYPVINGGGIAGATIVSVVLLKEKMDKKQKLGFALCVLSIILMCMA